MDIVECIGGRNDQRTVFKGKMRKIITYLMDVSKKI